MADIILLIDDDQDVLEVTRKTLELDGYQVITAADGQSGMDLVFKLLPDLVILDLAMPGNLNGYSVCEKIKNGRSTRNIPVLILSAKKMATDIETSLQKGADFFVSKPYDGKYLLENVKQLILKRKALMDVQAPAKQITPESAMEYRILVIDDDPDVLETTKDTLEFHGYQTISAIDGKTGLQMALSEKPDLIILDIMMPGGIDGYSVCRQIKADPSINYIPVLILTAKNMWEDAKKALETGATWYLTKPYDIKQLIDCVNKIIERIAKK